MKTYISEVPEVFLKMRKGTGVLKAKIDSSDNAAEFLRQIYDSETLEYYESFFALYLNKSNNTIAWIKISQGGISGTVADPRMIIKAALDCGASGMILSHNHPSGSAKPSLQDIKLTKKIKKAADVFDIIVLDHIIITDETFYSMEDKNDI